MILFKLIMLLQQDTIQQMKAKDDIIQADSDTEVVMEALVEQMEANNDINQADSYP